MLDLVQSCVKNIGDLLRKNNLRLRGLKENLVEGKDLEAFTYHFGEIRFQDWSPK